VCENLVMISFLLHLIFSVKETLIISLSRGPDLSVWYVIRSMIAELTVCQNFSGPFRVPQFPLYLCNADVVSHEKWQPSSFSLH